MRFPLLPSHSLSWRRRLLEYSIAIPVLYGVWLAGCAMLQERFIYPRDMAGPGRPAGSLPRNVESLWIDAGTPAKPIRIEAWYLPPLAAAPGAKYPAVIFFHGNAELIDNVVDHVRGWQRLGYAVLLPEYRGYGRSGGAPCQRDIVADAIRFRDLLSARPEIDPGQIIIHGRSLGGGVACQLAAVRPPRALVLESTFTSVASMAWRLGIPGFLCSSPYRNDRVLRTLGRPVLIMHGADDDIIPISHARRLHDITPGSSLAELPGHHNDFPADEDAYWAAIEAFLKSIARPG